ncbi:SMEK domain-containing protein, partial [Photobacterium carnosum]|uniref:SMEK domain-containing protein n=1 Tax=Photobacterium carnosum TaxID=2023717 RepID=UPI00242C6DC0
MKKDISLKEISGLLSRISVEVKMLNGSGFYDVNTICEDIFIPILKLVFNCPELKNMNENVDNFVAIDLGCSVYKTAFQVTSTPSSTKIIKTLEKYIENDFHHTFDHLKVFLLRDKINYRSKRLNELAAEINFDIESDIVDLNDLFKIIQSKDIDFIDSILDILNREFKKIDRYSLARDNIDLLTKNALLKVTKEKETKKYIPEVFNETTTIKDKARLFTNPYFFFPMILDKIIKLDFSIINEYFNKLEVKELSISDSVKLIMTHREYSEESILVIEKEFNELLGFINLFGYSVGEKHIPIKSENNDLYRLLKFAIQGEVYILYGYLEEIIDDIKSLKSRIFLVTSKAGQGKINFLCDFTENFCYKFNMPMVYIPARELNVISDCDIVSYIRNNRFFNEIKDKFDFFEFAESVSNKSKLPFVILIDGINEITNNVKFRQSFIDFISKSSQYDTIKVIVTCRSEFFEKQYNYFSNQELSHVTYHVKDLKSKLTDIQRENIVKIYLEYFNVNCSLSKDAEEALISDFLLPDYHRASAKVNNFSGIG